MTDDAERERASPAPVADDAEREQVRCPECGARNGADAEWCTQCYTSLVPPPSEGESDLPGTPGSDAETATEAAPDAASAVPPPPPPPPQPGSEGAPDGLLPLPPPPPGQRAQDDPTGAQPRPLQAGGGRFRETDEGLEWVCEVCQEWNPIERITCTVCATPFGRTLGAEAEPERPDVPAALLTVASLVLPGTGHWLLGMRGAAVLRALLGLVWGLGGLTLFLQARGSGQSFLPAIPLLLGWAVVAAGSANDAVVEGGGEGQLVLSGRVLLWLTLAVVGGTFAAVLVGVLSAVGS